MRCWSREIGPSPRRSGSRRRCTSWALAPRPSPCEIHTFSRWPRNRADECDVSPFPSSPGIDPGSGSGIKSRASKSIVRSQSQSRLTSEPGGRADTLYPFADRRVVTLSGHPGSTLISVPNRLSRPAPGRREPGVARTRRAVLLRLRLRLALLFGGPLAQAGERVPQPFITPAIELALHCRTRRKVLGEHAPLAARRRHIEDRIDDLSHIRRARPAKPVGFGEKRRDHGPAMNSAAGIKSTLD